MTVRRRRAIVSSRFGREPLDRGRFRTCADERLTGSCPTDGMPISKQSQNAMRYTLLESFVHWQAALVAQLERHGQKSPAHWVRANGLQLAVVFHSGWSPARLAEHMTVGADGEPGRLPS